MKWIGNLFERLESWQNLFHAARAARRGKRHRDYAIGFHFALEEELLCLQQELIDQSYTPGACRSFFIREPKRRMISAAPYRDRVVHHALYRILEPVFEKSFTHDSYACRRGKGTHRALDRLQSFCRARDYALQCDLEKYFPSIDHEILKETIAKKIKDSKVLCLFGKIIDCSNPQEEVYRFFPGDSLFTPYERRRGLPIGNLTSQFFANIYLYPIVGRIKQKVAELN